jgi:hypothetical protein
MWAPRLRRRRASGFATRSVLRTSAYGAALRMPGASTSGEAAGVEQRAEC